jgi:hypothetical protein
MKLPVALPLTSVLLLFCAGEDDNANPVQNQTAAPREVNTIMASGSVHNELGGADLSVFSIHESKAVPADDGEFTVRVSSEGVQALLLSDKQGKIWGLTLSVPEESDCCTIHAFTDSSTALAMLLLSPGIASIDPEAIRERTERLRTCAGFGPLVDFLDQSLRTTSLTDIFSGNAGESMRSRADSLATEVVEQYYQAVQSPLAKYIVDPGRPYLSVSIPDTADPDRTPVTIANKALRYVHVFRKSSSTLASFEMPGRVGVGFGSVLTATLLQPAIFIDTICYSKDREVDYWFYGPGFSSRDYTEFPPDIQAMLDKQNLKLFHTKSFLHYIFFPLIEMFSGVAMGLGKTAEVAANTASALAMTPDGDLLMQQIDSTFELKSGREFAKACIDLSASASSILLSGQMLAGATGLAFFIGNGALFAGMAGGLAFGTFNFTLTSLYYVSLPAKTVIHTTYIDTTAPQDLSGLGVSIATTNEIAIDADSKEIIGEFENQSDMHFTDLHFRIDFLDASGEVASFDQGYVYHTLLPPGYRTPFYFYVYGENAARPWRVRLFGRPTSATADETALKITESTLERILKHNAATDQYENFTLFSMLLHGTGLNLQTNTAALVRSYDEEGEITRFQKNQSFGLYGDPAYALFESSVAVGDTGHYNLLLQAVHTDDDRTLLAQTRRTGKFAAKAVLSGSYDSDRFMNNAIRTVYCGKIVNTGSVPITDLSCWLMLSASSRDAGSTIAAMCIAPGDSAWFMSSVPKEKTGTPRFRLEFTELHGQVVPKKAIDVVIARGADPRTRVATVTNKHQNQIKLYHAAVILRPEGEVRSISRGSSAGSQLASGQSREFSITLPDTLYRLDFAVQAVEDTP